MRIEEKKKNFVYFSIFFLSISFLIPLGNSADVKIDYPIELYYFYNPSCDICAEVGPDVYKFVEDNPNIQFLPKQVDFSDTTSTEEFYSFFEGLGVSVSGIPIVAFIKGECSTVIRGNEITSNRLNNVYSKLKNAENECPDFSEDDFDLDAISSVVLYGLGFVSGLSPCILLILGFVSASYLGSDEENEKENLEGKRDHENKIISPTRPKESPFTYLKFIFGFISGTILIYSLVSLAIIFSLDFLSKVIFGNIIQYIFAGLLIIVGLWYIIDANNSSSKLFKTPDVVKKMFKSIINTKSFRSSFVLGIVFTMIKLPCIGAILLALLLNMSSNVAYYLPRLIVFFSGVLTPLIIIATLLIYGLNSNKLNSIRIKYRPLLRFTSGVLIILIVLYSLFL